VCRNCSFQRTELERKKAGSDDSNYMGMPMLCIPKTGYDMFVLLQCFDMSWFFFSTSQVTLLEKCIPIWCSMTRGQYELVSFG